MILEEGFAALAPPPNRRYYLFVWRIPLHASIAPNGGPVANSLESTQQALTLARRAIESARDAAAIPKAYLNFDVALAIVDGCRSAIDMADARDPKTLIPKLEAASTSFALLEAGIAEPSVKAARAYVDRAVIALRASGVLE